ncbi:MAG: hypothetical protein EOP33_07040 [Rickettsiaceae bacterium]|nr:MAG: hypothetical protein EOP33_07040 [Rickettsiaceae bacterium]
MYIFTKIKRNSMGFDHWGEFLKSLVIVLNFLLFFVVFVRLFSLVRESRVLDLKIIAYNFDISFLILSFGCLWLVRKNIMFVVKLSFLKLHYFGSISYLPQNPYSKYYNKFYSGIIVRISSFFYSKTYWLDKILSIIMLCLVIRDLVLNNMVLDQCLCFAPWYSVYKLCFVCSRFVTTKQNFFLDYYLYCRCYAGTGYIPDEAPFYKGSNDSWRSITKKALEYEEEVIKV